jgi:hypothetical protein
MTDHFKPRKADYLGLAERYRLATGREVYLVEEVVRWGQEQGLLDCSRGHEERMAEALGSATMQSKNGPIRQWFWIETWDADEKGLPIVQRLWGHINHAPDGFMVLAFMRMKQDIERRARNYQTMMRGYRAITKGTRGSRDRCN